MGSMFRSDKMALCQIFMQSEIVYETVAELGEIGLVQFKDSNEDKTIYQRTFVGDVRRCEEIERQIGFVTSEITKFEIPVLGTDNFAEVPSPTRKQIQIVEEKLEGLELELKELKENRKELMAHFTDLTEHKMVLELSENIFSDQEVINFDLNSSSSEERRAQIGYIAGCVSQSKAFPFEKMVWRVSYGNTFIRIISVDSSDDDKKCVFVIFYQGETLNEKVRKICSGFHASLYPCSSSHDERNDMLCNVNTRLEDLKTILNKTEDQQRLSLMTISKELPTFTVQVKKMKAIFHTMNCFNTDLTSKYLIAESWISEQDVPAVRDVVSRISFKNDCTVESFVDVIQTKENPPTLIRTNKFTKGFQNLIDAYGLNTYREINPGLYTIITFPFLFGVMFGDMGHGLILLVFALWMVLCEKSLIEKGWKDEIWTIFFGGRYIILLMAVFAIYAGLIYNDIFSFSLNIFGNTWVNMYNESTVLDKTVTWFTLDPKSDVHDSYIMGIDPVWQLADNKIIFLNNFKMKMSIIFGIVHMSFGLFMNASNMINFKRYSSLILEFIPQFLFLILIFGYMVFLMIFKWVVYTAQPENDNDTYLKPGCAPSVLIEFINMVMFKSTNPETLPEGCELSMYSGQQAVQISLLVIGVLCVPWLLCGKPLYIRSLRNKRKRMNDRLEFLEQTKEALLEEVSALDNQSLEGRTSVSVNYQNVNMDLSEKLVPNESVSADQDEILDPKEELAQRIELVEIEHEQLTRRLESFEIEHDDMIMGDVWIYQAIHTVEYVLSTISHTASYLRLWALSLAHAQLSEVLYTKIFRMAFSLISSYYMVPLVFSFFSVWASLTVFILVIIEGLSAFLHTLRLHW
ncbi:unc-32.2 family protein [Megaselia abdita]